MERTPRELAARLERRMERLETDLEELARTVARPPATSRRDEDPLARISLGAWLRISGPTFAVMLSGFTLLWNAQQATSAQLLEVTRTLGRLDGAITRFEARLDSMDQTLQSMDRSIQSLDASVRSLDQRVDALGERVDALDGRIGSLGESVDRLAARLDEPR